ncbi:small ribosomal subunit Rsm22 family protein [bacterium]|jgi:SAM-dependent methyltransferase|nr:small ribosomal subunit Rsm22 family protein [bacterium]
MQQGRPVSHSQFSPFWPVFVDEIIPTWVKRTYSQKESWKSKPFTQQDAHFFYQGIEELSDLFTEERPSHMPAYFNHAKFRSSYLLYFLPLQAAKFTVLFEQHSLAMKAALEFAHQQDVYRVLDLGSGPGTASIALLLRLLQEKKPLPPIEFHWVDTNAAILKDGEELVAAIVEKNPKLKGKLTVRSYVGRWEKTQIDSGPPFALTLLGNVINEIPGASALEKQAAHRQLIKYFECTRGGGMLFVEPAAKLPSQGLSLLRNEFFESGILQEPTSLWGPCLHSGTCPMSEGRDWCHFSVPVQIPGNWFKRFSKGLGSERQWAKYSYLWLAATDHPAPAPKKTMRRVISDQLPGPLGKKALLLCEPNQVLRHPLPRHPKSSLRRGDLLDVGRPSQRGPTN